MLRLVDRPDDLIVIAQRPHAGALLLALIPFLGICFCVPLWDRVHPLLLGLPFNLFWLVGWIVLTTACLWAAYRLQTAQEQRQADDR